MFVDSCTVKGEALVVDLKDRGYLFFLLNGRGHDRTALAKGILASKPNPGIHRWQVRTEALPLVARFRDVKDHRTVEFVDPIDLPDILGRDVTFVGLMAEDTEAELTTGNVDRALPWMTAYEPTTNIQTGTREQGTGPAYDVQVEDFKTKGPLYY